MWKLRNKELRFFSHLKHLLFAHNSHRLLCISDGAKIPEWCLWVFLSALEIGKVVQIYFHCVSVYRMLGSWSFVKDWECTRITQEEGCWTLQWPPSGRSNGRKVDLKQSYPMSNWWFPLVAGDSQGLSPEREIVGWLATDANTGDAHSEGCRGFSLYPSLSIY